MVISSKGQWSTHVCWFQDTTQTNWQTIMKCTQKATTSALSKPNALSNEQRATSNMKNCTACTTSQLMAFVNERIGVVSLDSRFFSTFIEFFALETMLTVELAFNFTLCTTTTDTKWHQKKKQQQLRTNEATR